MGQPLKVGFFVARVLVENEELICSRQHCQNKAFVELADHLQRLKVVFEKTAVQVRVEYVRWVGRLQSCDRRAQGLLVLERRGVLELDHRWSIFLCNFLRRLRGGLARRRQGFVVWAKSGSLLNMRLFHFDVGLWLINSYACPWLRFVYPHFCVFAFVLFDFRFWFKNPHHRFTLRFKIF